MKKIRSSFLVAIAGLILTACSMTPIGDSAETPMSTEPPERWQAKGRFTYQNESERKTGQFDWQQNGSDYLVRIFGPFGMGAVKISGNDAQVEIESGDQSYLSDQPDMLFYELTGMHMPISQLSHWLTGDNYSSTTGTWVISYADFEPLDSYLLPTRIDLQNESVSLRIAVSDWSLDLAN
jgi:outer membrane lipoprotein LolB